MTSVTLRKRKRKNGRSYLLLEFYPPIFIEKTRETHAQMSLNMFVYDNPSSDEEREHNRLTMLRAEAIKSQRAIDVLNDELGFFDPNRFECSFLDYFKEYALKKHYKSFSCYIHFDRFMNGACRFGDLTFDLCNQFRDYLLKKAVKKDGEHLHHNSAVGYWSMFRSVLAQAYKEHYLKDNLNDYLEKIPEKKTHREYLTLPEVLSLCNTPCRFDVLKRAALFSILTGLRISDIMTLDWGDITIAPDGGPCIVKHIQKSDRDEIIYVSEEALSYCGRRYMTGPVFYGLTKVMTVHPLRRWVEDAGIKKHVTFHSFRHTFATLQLAMGTDIYTVSHQLSHRFVSTTQIYAELVDEKRRASANAVSLLSAPTYEIEEQ